MVFISPVTVCLFKGSHVYDPYDLGICLMDHTSYITAFVYFWSCGGISGFTQASLSKKKSSLILKKRKWQDDDFLVTGLFICTLLVLFKTILMKHGNSSGELFFGGEYSSMLNE